MKTALLYQRVRMMSGSTKITLDNLLFKNSTLKSVPIDPENRNFVRTVKGAIFSRVKPTPVVEPKLVVASDDALSLLGVTDANEEISRPDFAELMCGNKNLSGSEPSAHCYAGHQFGHFSGQLGDGATMYLGEVEWSSSSQEERVQHWELQFKGAGLTPYSRTADGRKVLRSSLREFLCSEAHYHLGIPTTRSASVVTSDSPVIRDIFYTGHPKEERATVITRIAQTFLRFGSFEIFKSTDSVTGRSGPSEGQVDLLRKLLAYTCRQYFPEIHTQFSKTGSSSSTSTDSEDAPERYLAMLDEICKRTARTAASWQVLGWCHGVLNTDNMSIVGVTLDYGPFGWMETFDRNFVCNASDNEGRYSYANQPRMCQWNCAKLGEAFSPCLGGLDWRPSVRKFAAEFSHHSLGGFRSRLGISGSSSSEGTNDSFSSNDEELFESLLATMHESNADYNNSFRVLMKMDVDINEFISSSSSSSSSSALYDDEALVRTLLLQCASASQSAELFKPRIPKDRLEMFKLLAESRPDIASQLDMINEELEKHDRYEELKRRSDDEKKSIDAGIWREWIHKFRQRLTAEAKHVFSTAGGEDGLKTWKLKRKQMLMKSNPKYILRNWIAQIAITAAEAGDFSIAQKVYNRLKDPYGLLDESEEDVFSKDLLMSEYARRFLQSTSEKNTVENETIMTTNEGFAKPPKWSTTLRVT